MIERAVELVPDYRHGQGQLYLGVMNSLLPPAYGGKPELAQRYFEEALVRSGSRTQYGVKLTRATMLGWCSTRHCTTGCSKKR